MPPLPRLHNPKATIILKTFNLFENLFRNLKKVFRQFVELVESNPLIYNTLHFDQYSRLTILLDIFRYSAKISKTNYKFEKNFPLVCRACQDESIDVQHQRFRIKTKPAIRLKIVVQTDRRNLFRNLLS